MSQRSERALLGLDSTGSYWIICYNSDSTASTFVINKTGPNTNVEELFDTEGEILQSEKLQELKARSFKRSRYIEDFQAFEAACRVACAQRLRERRQPDATDNKEDWIVEDIDCAGGTFDKTKQTGSQYKRGSMFKRQRDPSPDSPPWSKRRHLERDAFDFGHGDTYRPSYVRHGAEAVSPSAKGRQEARDAFASAPASPPSREVHSGVDNPRFGDRSEQPRKPMQQLRQMNTSAATGPSARPHENSSFASKRLNGDDRYKNQAGATNDNDGFSGVPRGPKHQARPSRPPQSPKTQQKAYSAALDEKNPDVIPPRDLTHLREKPHIYISSSDVPFLTATIPHLQRFIRREIRGIFVKADVSGYYLFSDENELGRVQLQRCYKRYNRTKFFGEYVLHMELRSHGDVTQKRRLSKEGGKTQRKTDVPLHSPENRFDGPITLADAPLASHLQPKADDEISMSSVIAPSEISSSATRVKTHCADCKNGHFPSYNPKFGCSTCPRHYHSKCRKPSPRPSEDLTTWQCNYCIKKKRPKPTSGQPRDQNKPSESRNPHEYFLDTATKSVGQILMGSGMVQPSSQIVDGTTEVSQARVPEAQMVTGDSRLESEVSDPQLRNMITDPQPQDKAVVTNGHATSSKMYKHSSGTKPMRDEHAAPYNYNALTPGTADLLHKMQFHTGERNNLELSGQPDVEKSSTLDARLSVPAATNGVSSDQQKSTRPQQTTDYGPAPNSSNIHVDEVLPSYAQQSDLLPEIPDFALDISVASSGTNLKSPKAQSSHAGEMDAQVAGRTLQSVSDGKSLSLMKSDAAPFLPPASSSKRHSLVRCSLCGKTIFSVLGRTEEPICASCKNKKPTTGGDESGPQIAETPEEVWRRKLQLVPHQPEELAEPRRKTLQDAQAPQPGTAHLEQGTDSSVIEKPAWASAPPAPRSKAKKMALKRAISPLLNAHRQASGKNASSPLEDAGGAEAAGNAAQAIGGGPSSEPSPLVRRSCSPVNENINNDDAGMRLHDAQPTTGLTGAKNTRCDAEPGVQSVDGSKDTRDVTAPPAKLPGSFSWPELIGFALAEASDHRMTAAQVHQWIVDNVDGYDIHNTTHRSSIAATLSQQKAKFPKAEPVMEGSRQLSRWMLASSFVSGYKEELKTHRDRLRKERSLQATRGGTTPRRKDLNAAAKATHSPANPSTSRATHPQKEMSKMPAQPTETEMFIKRHRVAYDADGRDIVPGFKDVPIEKWTELARVESFKKNGIRFCVGDYINVPLPNRFKFADYTHKPLVQTMAQIEEIRQRRDGPGYAVLVQWFVTKEAAEWWKCRHVKSFWPKDDKSGIYVPATVWDVLTSEFISQQEKLDPEETRRQIIQDLFFEMDTDAWLLYLKQGRGPDTGIAFSSRSDRPIQEAEDTAAGLDRPGERSLRTSRQAQDDSATLSQITHGTKPPASLNHTSSQEHLVTPSGIPHRLRTPHKPALSIDEGWETGGFMETLSTSPEPNPAGNPSLERQLFTPPSMIDPVKEVSEARRTSHLSQAKRSTSPSKSKPEKRQHTGVTPDEQAAIRALLQQEQANAPYKAKDLFAAAPECNPANALWDRDAKMAEIKARPSRKARFTQRLAYARLERSPHSLHNEVERPLPKAYRAPPFNRPGSGYSNSSREFRFDEVGSRDADMRDATAHSQTTNGVIDSSDPSKPEIFDTLEELLDLPTNLIPTLYDGRLAFRDGTMLPDGTLPRAKKVWKVGRNVPGELK